MCQLSLCCTEPTDIPESPHTPGISPTPSFTTYHPYAQSPSALTEYLQLKLCQQRVKRQSRSHPAQVEQNIPLKCNNKEGFWYMVHKALYFDGHEWDDVTEYHQNSFLPAMKKHEAHLVRYKVGNTEEEVVLQLCYVFPFALLYTDTSDCLLPSLPHPLTGLLYFYDLILPTRFPLVASCPV